MGPAISALTRRIQRFNVENRAHREISKEKPTPAPTYPSTVREIERISQENPHLLEELSRKDGDLHQRLKSVFLVSHDIRVEKSETADAGRALPSNRSTPEETDFGFYEPKMIPKGRVTLRQALKFIAEHQSDPGNITASSIATEHNINLQMTENILKYFKTFEIFMPEIEKKEIGGDKITVTHIEGGKPVDKK